MLWLFSLYLSQVWVYAAAQVFNSIGIAFGSLIAFASYNKFHGPILRDTLIVVIIDAVTCMLCGLAVFSTLGERFYIFCSACQHSEDNFQLFTNLHSTRVRRKVHVYYNQYNY